MVQVHRPEDFGGRVFFLVSTTRAVGIVVPAPLPAAAVVLERPRSMRSVFWTAA